MPKWDKEKIAVLETNQLNMAQILTAYNPC